MWFENIILTIIWNVWIDSSVYSFIDSTSDLERKLSDEVRIHPCYRLV